MKKKNLPKKNPAKKIVWKNIYGEQNISGKKKYLPYLLLMLASSLPTLSYNLLI